MFWQSPETVETRNLVDLVIRAGATGSAARGGEVGRLPLIRLEEATNGAEQRHVILDLLGDPLSRSRGADRLRRNRRFEPCRPEMAVVTRWPANSEVLSRVGPS